MAARELARPLRLQELRSVSAPVLSPMFEEEKARWLALLHWDFSPSAELVSRYVAMQALDGYALYDDEQAVGYVYWVVEEHKGLIGDLYLRDAWRSPANENLLLLASLEQLRRGPWIRRIEAQLMQLTSRGSQVSPGGLRPRSFPRHFMLAPTSGIDALRPVSTEPDLRLERWRPLWLDEAAQFISSVYSGHIDSQINDQYRSPQGARRFLQNIVQYPGCGAFSHDASLVALDPGDRVRGVCLASKVAPSAGHIPQLCLAPRYHGCGAAYEMLRRSIFALADTGASEVSLTVTGSNERAIRLYERFGFRAVHQFEALVWENL